MNLLADCQHALEKEHLLTERSCVARSDGHLPVRICV